MDEDYPTDDGPYPLPHDESDWDWLDSIPFVIPGNDGPAWDILRQSLTEDKAAPLNAKASAPSYPNTAGSSKS